MTYCPKCGRKLETQSPYCPFCGAPLAVSSQATHAAEKKDRRKAIAAILGVSGLLGLGFIAFRYYGDEIAEILSKMTGWERTITVTETARPAESSKTSISSSTAYTSETIVSSPSILSPTTTMATTTSANIETTPTETTSSTTTTRTTVIPSIPERDWDHIIFPYIEVGGQAYYDQVEATVINLGNSPSYYTVMELYGGPTTKIPGIKYVEYPLSSFNLAWRGVTTLNTSQRINLDFSELLSEHEVLIWVCYDPILDPKGFTMDSSTQLKSIYRRSDDRDRHVMAFGRSGVVED